MDNTAYTEELKRIENAETILWYASNNNIKVDNAIINSVLNFKAFLLKGGLSSDTDHDQYTALKKEFYKCSTMLNNLKGINAKGILAIDKKKYLINIGNYKLLGFSFSERLMISYKIIMVSVMIITMLGHFYWFTGLSYMQQYDEVVQNIHSIASDLELVDSLSVAYLDLSDEYKEKQIDKTNIVLALCNWSAVLRPDSGWFETANFANISRRNCNEGFCKALENQKKISRMVVINLRFLDNYVLPLLYGLLGAIIYSLRNLASEIKNYTVNRFSKINYATRLFLGAFAGIAIGWFVSSGQNTINASKIYNLSPIILAFVAGYNIEFLFLLIDRYIRGIKKPAKKKEANSDSSEQQ